MINIVSLTYLDFRRPYTAIIGRINDILLDHGIHDHLGSFCLLFGFCVRISFVCFARVNIGSRFFLRFARFRLNNRNAAFRFLFTVWKPGRMCCLRSLKIINLLPMNFIIKLYLLYFNVQWTNQLLELPAWINDVTLKQLIFDNYTSQVYFVRLFLMGNC